MFFAINTSDKAVLACDGRLTAAYYDKKTGELLEKHVYDDTFSKISVIGTYLLGITGNQEISEKFKEEILNKASADNTFDEIIAIIEDIFRLNVNCFDNNSKHNTISLVLSGVNNGLPMFVFYTAYSNCHSDNMPEKECGEVFHKSVHKEPGFISAIRDNERGELFNYFKQQIELGTETTDAVISTFKEGNRLNEDIGGLIRIFIADKSGAGCIRSENISNVTAVTSGTMSADRIHGGTITGTNFQIGGWFGGGILDPSGNEVMWLDGGGAAVFPRMVHANGMFVGSQRVLTIADLNGLATSAQLSALAARVSALE